MQENTVNGLVQAIKLFAAIAGCIIIVLAFFWLILGTFVMQLLTMSAFITGVFLLGSWWNDYVQDKERQMNGKLINAIVPLLIAQTRGNVRTDVAAIETSASQFAMLQDTAATIQEIN